MRASKTTFFTKILFSLVIAISFILGACAPNAPDPGDNQNEQPEIKKPVIEGIEDAFIGVGHYFDLFEGITAKDGTGKDISKRLVVSGNYDFSTEGIYELVYSVTDKDGNETTATRNINVISGLGKETPQPVDRNIKNGVNELGQGSFAAGNPQFPSNRRPKNIVNLADDLKQKPVPSSEFWTSLIIERDNKFGDRLIANPLLVKYSASGLAIANPGSGAASETVDLYFNVKGLNANAGITVVDYSDFGVTVSLSDSNTTCKMLTYINQGSPYVFARFSGGATPVIQGNGLQYFDEDLNRILEQNGQYYQNDHLIVTSRNGKNYWVINAPETTIFNRTNNTIEIVLPDGYDYVSVGAVPAPKQGNQQGTPSKEIINTIHEHGYAFVVDTYVDYDLLEDTNEVVTDYYFRIWQADTGHSSDTVMVLRPNQHFKSKNQFINEYYGHVRGDTKVSIGKSFRTVDKFNGVIPSFVEPNNPQYSRAQLKSYLQDLDNNTNGSNTGNDAYWQGKSAQILAQGILMADQIGETEIRDRLVAKLKVPLTNWLTYDAENESGKERPYFYYDPSWGTLLQYSNAYGYNSNMADHHFHLGYLVFSSAVLASYDEDFREGYKEMIDLMVRDYASPYRDDPMFCYMRSFDLFAGHSWASGYGDNVSGNNQESTSEALNGYAGMYLWGVVSGNEEFKKAGAYIFTTELLSTKEYWFNYSGTSFYSGYNHGTVGILWGTFIAYGTWFSGDAHCIYGIQWIPTGEYLTSHVLNDQEQERFRYLYQYFLQDSKGNYQWRDLCYPMNSLFDPDAVFTLWGNGSGLNTMGGKCDNNTGARVYMFVNNMKSFNRRTELIWAKGGNSATFYEKKDGTVIAQVWNPLDTEQEFTFVNHAGAEQKYTAPANSLTLVEVTLEKAAAPQTPAGWDAQLNWTALLNK